MRKLLVAVFVAIFCLAPKAISAKPPADQQDEKSNVEKRIEQLTKKLNLTPAQQTSIKSILEEERSQLKALKREHHEKEKAVRTGARSKIEALLTANQMAEYEKLREEMKKRHEQRKKEGKTFKKR